MRLLLCKSKQGDIIKTYTIIAGVNGTGRTSFTGTLKMHRKDLGTVIDIDRMAAAYGSHIEAGRKAVKTIDDCISREICFTQETTLSGIRTEHTIQKAFSAGYYIRLYYIGLDTAEESIKRIANRVSKGGHDIPSSDVERRYKTRFDSLARIMPYCDEVTLIDNENGFTEVAVFSNDELLQLGDYCPHWLKELKEKMKTGF